MKHILFLVLALVAVLVAVNFVSEGTLSDGVAVATRVQGTVRIFARNAPEGRQLGNDDSVAKNDRVEVQGNSRLELRLPDGSWLRLSENARLTVQKLQFEKRTGTLYLQARLEGGRLWAKMRKPSPNSWAEIVAGACSAAGKETVFGVDEEGDMGATVTVYEGTALAAGAANAPRSAGQASTPAAAQPVDLHTLQQVSVSGREGVSQPRALDLKASINDWVRWNLQRDAREGLASVTLAPASPTITRGSSLQLAALAHYPENIERDITSFATWSTSDVKVAKIGPFGTAEGTELGASTISASIEEVSGSTVLNVSRDVVAIKVTPASRSIVNGAVQQFTAVGTFSDRTVKDITSSAVWRSTNPNVAFVDSAGRAVAGNVSGTAVISASLGSKRGSATLRVRRELVSITILPDSAIIIPGDTQRFGAIGNYSDKTTQDLTELVEWESSDLRIAVIDQVQSGRVLGQDPGNATIKATFKNISGSATITVERIPSR